MPCDPLFSTVLVHIPEATRMLLPRVAIMYMVTVPLPPPYHPPPSRNTLPSFLPRCRPLLVTEPLAQGTALQQRNQRGGLLARGAVLRLCLACLRGTQYTRQRP